MTSTHPLQFTPTSFRAPPAHIAQPYPKALLRPLGGGRSEGRVSEEGGRGAPAFAAVQLSITRMHTELGEHSTSPERAREGPLALYRVSRGRNHGVVAECDPRLKIIIPTD